MLVELGAAPVSSNASVSDVLADYLDDAEKTMAVTSHADPTMIAERLPG